MPLINRDNAKTFEMHGATFLGLASPSRGSRENAVWVVTLPAGSAGVEHSVDREEIIVGIDGEAEARIDGEFLKVLPNDALVVPAGAKFQIGTPRGSAFRGVVVLPVGALAQLAGQAPFGPPWAK